MPRALDPHSTQEIVLACDKKGRKTKRPTFIFRSLSAEQWRRIAGINDSIDRTSVESALDSILDPIWDNLVDWRNMVDPQTGKPIKFSKPNLYKIVSVAEATELCSSLLTLSQVSGQQMGNSASPSSSSTVSSARRARRASAKNVRRKPSRH